MQAFLFHNHREMQFPMTFALQMQLLQEVFLLGQARLA